MSRTRITWTRRGKERERLINETARSRKQRYPGEQRRRALWQRASAEGSKEERRKRKRRISGLCSLVTIALIRSRLSARAESSVFCYYGARAATKAPDRRRGEERREARERWKKGSGTVVKLGAAGPSKREEVAEDAARPRAAFFSIPSTGIRTSQHGILSAVESSVHGAPANSFPFHHSLDSSSRIFAVLPNPLPILSGYRPLFTRRILSPREVERSLANRITRSVISEFQSDTDSLRSLRSDLRDRRFSINRVVALS